MWSVLTVSLTTQREIHGGGAEYDAVLFVHGYFTVRSKVVKSTLKKRQQTGNMMTLWWQEIQPPRSLELSVVQCKTKTITDIHKDVNMTNDVTHRGVVGSGSERISTGIKPTRTTWPAVSSSSQFTLLIYVYATLATVFTNNTISGNVSLNLWRKNVFFFISENSIWVILKYLS